MVVVAAAVEAPAASPRLVPPRQGSNNSSNNNATGEQQKAPPPPLQFFLHPRFLGKKRRKLSKQVLQYPLEKKSTTRRAAPRRMRIMVSGWFCVYVCLCDEKPFSLCLSLCLTPTFSLSPIPPSLHPINNNNRAWAVPTHRRRSPGA